MAIPCFLGYKAIKVSSCFSDQAVRIHTGELHKLDKSMDYFCCAFL